MPKQSPPPVTPSGVEGPVRPRHHEPSTSLRPNGSRQVAVRGRSPIMTSPPIRSGRTGMGTTRFAAGAQS